MRQPEENNQDRASRHDRQNRTASTALSKQYCQDRTIRVGQPGQLGQAARKGDPEQDSTNGTCKTGQKNDGMQIKKAWTGQPARTACQDCQYRTVRTGLPRQDGHDRTAKTDFQDTTSWTE